MRQVKLDVAEDESRLFGHAAITFPEQLGPSPRLSLSITRRSQDTPHLGEAGWQARPATVGAEVVRRTPASTTVVVGPEVCERIPVHLQVRIEAPGAGVWGSAFWPAVAARMPAWSEELTAPPPPLPERVLERKPEPPPVPVVAPPPVVPRKPERRRPPNLLILFLLAAAGGGVYLAPDWSSLRNRVWPVETLAERFEKLKQAEGHADELFALSSDAYEDSERDIGWQSINLATERGSTDAKLELARWHDPLTFAEDRVGGPDANAAARAYFELALEGNAEGRRLLRTLCEAAASPRHAQESAFAGLKRDTYCVPLPQ